MDITPTDRTASREFYLAYLNSPDWRRQRNRALKRAHFSCSRCGAKRGLEVHHLTYERLGHEHDSDLEVICHDCHESHHATQLEQSSARIYLRIASAVLQRDIFASIADLNAAIKDECARLKVPYSAHQVDRAIGIVAGNRLVSPPQTVEEVRKAEGRPVTHLEARTTLRRLGIEAAIKVIPNTVSRIDIYAPVPPENWGEHDLY